MDINLKRHKLLKILSIHHHNVELKKAKYNSLGVSFSDILKELKCNEDQLQNITTELYTSNEIGFHNASNIIGLYAENKGLSSFSNKKYKKLYWDNIINNTKNIIQIFIPVFSLIIAFVAISTNLNHNQKQDEKELQDIKLLLLKQQERITLLEYHIHTTQEHLEKKKI